jgi:hypothetical protein
MNHLLSHLHWTASDIETEIAKVLLREAIQGVFRFIRERIERWRTRQLSVPDAPVIGRA